MWPLDDQGGERNRRASPRALWPGRLAPDRHDPGDDPEIAQIAGDDRGSEIPGARGEQHVVHEAAPAEAPGETPEFAQPAIDFRSQLPAPHRRNVDAATGPERLQERLFEGATMARV